MMNSVVCLYILSPRDMNDMCAHTPFAHTLLKAFHFTAMKRDEAIFLRSISLFQISRLSRQS